MKTELIKRLAGLPEGPGARGRGRRSRSGVGGTRRRRPAAEQKGVNDGSDLETTITPVSGEVRERGPRGCSRKWELSRGPLEKKGRRDWRRRPWLGKKPAARLRWRFLQIGGWSRLPRVRVTLQHSRGGPGVTGGGRNGETQLAAEAENGDHAVELKGKWKKRERKGPMGLK